MKIILGLWALVATTACFGINYYHEQRAVDRENEIAAQYREVKYVDDQARVATRTVNQRELTCLAENIYHEAAGESLAGKMAVGLVTLNRVRSGKFAKTVCGVVNQRVGGSCQFSWRCEPGLVTRNNQQWKPNRTSRPVGTLRTHAAASDRGESANSEKRCNRQTLALHSQESNGRVCSCLLS